MALTPYDTGETAEPFIWQSGKRQHIGKVDFDDDEGATVATVQVKRNDDGSYTVHVHRAYVSGVKVEVHGEEER